MTAPVQVATDVLGKDSTSVTRFGPLKCAVSSVSWRPGDEYSAGCTLDNGKTLIFDTRAEVRPCNHTPARHPRTHARACKPLHRIACVDKPTCHLI